METDDGDDDDDNDDGGGWWMVDRSRLRAKLQKSKAIPFVRFFFGVKHNL